MFSGLGGSVGESGEGRLGSGGGLGRLGSGGGLGSAGSAGSGGGLGAAGASGLLGRGTGTGSTMASPESSDVSVGSGSLVGSAAGSVDEARATDDRLTSNVGDVFACVLELGF